MRFPDEFPNMLHVFKGKTERIPLSKPEFAEVSVQLRKRVLAYVVEEGHIILRTAFIRQSADGLAMIACKTEETKAWYKAVVEALEIDGVTYRAWDTASTSHLKEARINITDLGVEPTEVLQLIKGFNPKLIGDLQIIRKDVQSSSFGTKEILVIGIDDDMAACLGTKEEPWVVDLGTDQRTVSYRGIAALKSRLREKGMLELADALDKASVSGEEEAGTMDDGGDEDK